MAARQQREHQRAAAPIAALQPQCRHRHRPTAGCHRRRAQLSERPRRTLGWMAPPGKFNELVAWPPDRGTVLGTQPPSDADFHARWARLLGPPPDSLDGYVGCTKGQSVQFRGAEEPRRSPSKLWREPQGEAKQALPTGNCDEHHSVRGYW